MALLQDVQDVGALQLRGIHHHRELRVIHKVRKRRVLRQVSAADSNALLSHETWGPTQVYLSGSATTTVNSE